MTQELATFAARYSLTPANAYVLPALFEHAAKAINMPVRALIAEATYRNPKLGEYLAGCTAKVALEDGARH